jgi:hypothetical protein
MPFSLFIVKNWSHPYAKIGESMYRLAFILCIRHLIACTGQQL